MQTMAEIAEEERLRDLADITWLMENAAGRRIMNRLIVAGHIFQFNFFPDPRMQSLWDGERNLALQFFNDITEAAPKKYQVMMLEAKERRHRRQKKEQDAMNARNEGERE